jgi:diguanylate cyclase (GGDEF)-like protein
MARLRPYDIVVRIGGDEFLCGLTNTEPDAAKQRFEEVSAAISAASVAGSISVGLASLRAGDTIDDLVNRADAAMYSARQTRSGWTPPPSGSPAPAEELSSARAAPSGAPR